MVFREDFLNLFLVNGLVVLKEKCFLVNRHVVIKDEQSFIRG